jgi:hypothetical protein
MARPPIHRVTEQELRALFNAVVLPRIEAGDVLEAVQTEHPANPNFGQPSGTLSQIVAYWEVKNGKIGAKLAIAHRYLRPDGSLGGSGLPDPKNVFDEGKLFVAK